MIKESVTSLRILFAVYAVFWCYSIIMYVISPEFVGLEFFEILSLVIAAGYLYFAWTLKAYLKPSEVMKPITFVLASLGLLLVLVAYDYLTEGVTPGILILADVFIVVAASVWMKKLATK